MISGKITILGPGLLGGSLALALQQRGFAPALWARREEAVAEIQSLSLPVFASTDLETCVHDSALVILCTPVETMPDLLRRILPALHQDCIVTDVGSVKNALVAELESIAGDRIRVVGSHPMAGSEQTGIRHGRADLFEAAACIVTPTPASDSEAVRIVCNFWKELGCRVTEMPPADHDHAIARVSHLPHLAAAALVNIADTANNASLCGNGFLDTTRVASGSAELWTGILQANRAGVLESIDALVETLNRAKEILEQGDPAALTSFLKQAKTARDSVKALRNHGPNQG